MSEVRERLIDAVAKPLEKNSEQHLAAGQWVGEMLVEDESTFAEPIRRWEEIDRRPPHPVWRKWFWPALLVVAFAAMTPYYQKLQEFRMLPATVVAAGPMGSGNYHENSLSRLVTKRLSGKDLLLIGDPDKATLQQKEDLWDSDPQNPAYFAEYAVIFEATHHKLPADYFEISQRLAPDNAWFDYFAAGAVANKAVERVKQSKAEKEAKVPQRWKILDEAAVSEALEIATKARGKTRFQTYEERLARQRIPLLPQARYSERIASTAYLAGCTSLIISVRNFSNAISAKAGQIADTNDIEGFRELRRDGLNFINLMSKNEDIGLINELVFGATAGSVAESLQTAALKLGVSAESPELERLHATFKQFRAESEVRRNAENAKSVFLERHGGMIAVLSLPMVPRQVENPPPITDDDLKPGRMTDFAIASLLSSLAMTLPLGVCLLAVFLYRFRVPISLRIISKRIENLLQPVDWMLIFAAGVVLPIVFMLGISWLTPSGGKDLSIRMSVRDFRFFTLLQPVACYLSLFFMILISTIIATRWRLAVRGAAFGFRNRSWIGCIAISGLAGFIVFYLHLPVVWLSALVVPAIAWIAFMAGRSLFNQSRSLLLSATVARVLVPASTVAICCMVCLAFAFESLGQYWFERDDFMKLTADAPAMAPYEYRVAQQLRSEIRASME